MFKCKMSGFTLIELLITVTVIGIIAAIALPSFKSTIENRKLIAAANTLQADLMFAKSNAIKQSRTTFVSFENIGNQAWCYGINELSACDCSVANDCNVESQEIIRGISDLPSVTLSSSDENDISFTPVRGFVNNPTTIIFSLSGKTAGVNLSLSGHARACSNSSLGGMTGC